MWSDEHYTFLAADIIHCNYHTVVANKLKNGRVKNFDNCIVAWINIFNMLVKKIIEPNLNIVERKYFD